MKSFPVFNAQNQYIGYLILDDQLYFPYTEDDYFLGKGFFNPSHAENYLLEYHQQNPSGHPSPSEQAEPFKK